MYKLQIACSSKLSCCCPGLEYYAKHSLNSFLFDRLWIDSHLVRRKLSPESSQLVVVAEHSWEIDHADHTLLDNSAAIHEPARASFSPKKVSKSALSGMQQCHRSRINSKVARQRCLAFPFSKCPRVPAAKYYSPSLIFRF